MQLSGHHLRDGHLLALTTSGCAESMQPVLQVIDEGVSQPAIDDGQTYIFGKGNAVDFAPGGGLYGLCWCADMPGLRCASLESFQISVGHIEVVGPFTNHSFTCVRGQDCAGLQPLQGRGSLVGQVSLRTASCAMSSSGVRLSAANQHGTGRVEEDLATNVFTLSFGVSDMNDELDHSEKRGGIVRQSSAAKFFFG